MQTIQKLRPLSKIFSPPIFQKIVRENDYSMFQKQTNKYYNTNSHQTNLEIIKSLYRSLQKQYRCEYIYKNKLINDIIKSYSLESTLTLNEFKIGASKADLILLNGQVRVYEIKTELDGLEKLEKQIKDYQKLANLVHIVTDLKYAKKLLVEYQNTSVGIIALNSKNKLETIKEAYANESFLDFTTIFKILRKQEYLDLVEANFGFIPDKPNTQIFKACHELLATLDIINFQKQVSSKIKERKLLNPDLLKSSKTPRELKHICNSLDFNEQEYQRLYNFLASKNACTNHILEENSLS